MKNKEYIIPILLSLSLFICTVIDNIHFMNVVITLCWINTLFILFLCIAIYLFCFGDFDKNAKDKILKALENIPIRNKFLLYVNISSLILIAFNGWIVTAILFIIIFMFSRFLIYCSKVKLKSLRNQNNEM